MPSFRAQSLPSLLDNQNTHCFTWIRPLSSTVHSLHYRWQLYFQSPSQSHPQWNSPNRVPFTTKSFLSTIHVNKVMPNILIASLSTKLFESPNIYVGENDEASTVCDDNIIPVRKGSIRENQVSESRDIYSSLHRRQQLLSKTTW